MRDILELRQKFEGKRIFAIGNGPSLNSTQLDLIQGEYSIAMNRISLIYNQTLWRPNFFVCSTTNVKRYDWRSDIQKTMDLGIKSFIWDQIGEFLDCHENTYLLNCEYGSEVRDDPPIDWWSNDLAKSVTKFGTSMLVALQICNYLGFQEVYLLGCDLAFKNYKDGDKDLNHFSSEHGTPGLDYENLNRNMMAAHKLALKASSLTEMTIYNATPSGALEIYPRVSLTDVFANV